MPVPRTGERKVHDPAVVVVLARIAPDVSHRTSPPFSSPSESE
jgi:hypothetical protein